MRKNILLEEIGRIQEIMGIKPKNKIFEAAGTNPVVYNLVEDFLKKMGFKSESEIDEAYRLVNEFERINNQKQKLEFTTRLSDDGKKLMESAKKMKQDMQIEKDDLIKVFNKDSEQIVEHFAENLFASPAFKEMAAESFRSVNPTAKNWDIYLNKKTKDFDNVESINSWAQQSETTINNANIPDYIKKYYIETINKNKDKLTQSFQAWKQFQTSPEYFNIIKTIKNKDTKTKFNQIAKRRYELAMETGDVATIVDDLEKIAKILNTNVQNWTKEDINMVVKLIMDEMNNNTSLEKAVNSYKTKLEQDLHINPTFFSRECRNVWISKSESEKATQLSNALASLISLNVDKQFVMKFKYNKCLFLPFIIVTVFISLITGISIWLQLKGVYKIPVLGPIFRKYFGYYSADEQLEKFNELFPSLRFLTFTENFNREAFFKLIKKEDPASEEDKKDEPTFFVLKVSLNGVDYTVYCDDTSSYKTKNDKNNWKVINQDGTVQSASNFADKYNLQNEFAAFVTEVNPGVYGAELPNFSVKDYFVTSTTENIVEVYKKDNKNNSYLFEKQNDSSWLLKEPSINDFLKWIISDSGTSEGWGPAKKEIIDTEGKKDYKAYKDKKQYIIQDTKDPKYKEIYEYDAENKTFKFIS